MPVSSSSSAPEIRVLLIEDNKNDILLTTEALEKAGLNHELNVLTDGTRAIQRLKEIEDRVKRMPDLIILDLNLPGVDGNTIIDYIAASTTLAPIPVVVFTSSSSPKDKDAVGQLQHAKFITKPLDLNEYLSVGRVILGFFQMAKN
jgi:CheY-like chemotaxis protein